jgi:hypothetical protein
MIIWLTALVLVAIGMLAGYLQGAIRASSSIAGLILASFLALPLSGLCRPVVVFCGVTSPFWLAALSPVVGFVVVLIAAKVAGQSIHQKVEYFYRYKKETRFTHWERMNKRVGLCVGVLGGCIYFFLVSLVVYVGGYLTYQLSSGEKDTTGLRTLNSARMEISRSHFDRVLAAHDPAPAEYYDAADVAGLVYHNVLLEGRIRRYPAFLALAERPEFQELGNDAQFQNLWYSGPTLNQILEYPKVKAMVDNPVMVATLKRTVGENLKDLREFLETGKSPKFGGEKILGRWVVNIEASYVAERRLRKDLTPVAAGALKALLRKEWSGTVFIAGPENSMALIKLEAQTPGADPAPSIKDSGSWSDNNGSISVSLTADNKTETSPVTFDGEDRLTLTLGGLPLVYEREM